jgi:hypothetical protein
MKEKPFIVVANKVDLCVDYENKVKDLENFI